MSGTTGNTTLCHRLSSATGFLIHGISRQVLLVAGSALALLLPGARAFAADGASSLLPCCASHGGWRADYVYLHRAIGRLAYAGTPADLTQIFSLGQDTGLSATAGDELRPVRPLWLPVVTQGEHEVGNCPSRPIDDPGPNRWSRVVTAASAPA
jgi:hypothetical protein